MLWHSGRQTAVMLALSVPLLLVLAGGGWQFVSFVTHLAEDLERRETLALTSIAAAAFESDDIAHAATDRAALRQVQDELQRLKRHLSRVRFARIVSPTGGHFTILAGADADVGQPASRGLDGNVQEEALHRVLRTGKSEIAGPYRDGTGVWVSSTAPIFDDRDGSVLAILSFDLAAADWEADVSRFAEFGSAIAILVGVLVVLSVVGLFAQSQYQARIARLNSSLEREVAELALSTRIVENSSTIVMRLDPLTITPTYISRSIARYGHDAGQMVENPGLWNKLFHPDDWPGMNADVQQLLKGESDRARREFRMQKSDGSWVWFDGQLTAVRDAAHRMIALEGVMVDVTEHKKAEERIQYLANYDALTGLSNRSAFVARLQLAFAEAKRGGPGFAVLYMDIDHFKDLNDAFGQETGDLFLKAVATRLSSAIREVDAVGRFSIARLGGDEFAILQNDVADASDAAALAQRLNRVLSLPYTINDNELHATVSIGIALYDNNVNEPNDMLSQADLALYRAKDGGRNQFHFHSNELDKKVRERATIAEELHAAIENGELELYYQPQVAIPSGRIVGVEALMRWNHPKRGLVPPAVFIPVAEKTGLIVAMGRWAIEQACRQMQIWRRTNLEPATMGVNVSAVQIRNAPDFDREVEDVLQRTGTNPELLELELTESILIETTETHNEILHRLRKSGVRIAIDDFGTGYSSLQYLQAYPITRIKIAQQFMHEATDNPSDAAIVRATIGLARALKIDMIAEGVETSAQTAFLRASGCPTVQGYFFSRPVNAKDTTELLEQKSFERTAWRAAAASSHGMPAQYGTS